MTDKSCKKCNNGINVPQWIMIVLSFYILFAAIYGTIKLLGDLKSMF
jgi:hypothetical protein